MPEEYRPLASDTKDIASNFKLERYKYILQQIHFLNENLHKYLTLLQTLATAIVGAGVAVFVSAQKLSISAEVARVSIYGLLGLLVMLAIFVILSILAGIFSWLDYRKEEVALLNEAVGASFRVQPRIGNFWRWYETYMILFIIVFVVVTYCFVEDQVIPRIKTATDQAKTELAW